MNVDGSKPQGPKTSEIPTFLSRKDTLLKNASSGIIKTAGASSMIEQSRKLIYLGSSEKDATKLPDEVQELFAYALKVALAGGQHPDAKPLQGFNSRGILEVVSDYRSSTFREVYTVRYKEAVYVLHIFQKKSKKGIKTPKQDMDLIIQRLKWAETIQKEHYGKKKTRK